MVMDNQEYLNKDSFNLYYYDDDRQKHLVYNPSLDEIKFISDRFGKENVKVFESKPFKHF